MGFIEKENKTYAIITADGALRISSNENNPMAVKREIEKSDGSKAIKYELIKKGYKGFIDEISFKETDFGKMLNIIFAREKGEANQVVLSLNTNTNFGTDFMRKLPNVDLKKELSINPFSFVGDNGKPVKGITIWQGEEGSKEKIVDFFRDKDGKSINDIPQPEKGGKGFDKDDWKMYFTNVKKFLIKFTEDNIVPALQVVTMERFANNDYDPKDEMKLDDVNFED